MREDDTLRLHRAIDGISEASFEELLLEAGDRGELHQRYANQFAMSRGDAGGRWFDKSPQNVYGLLLINALFPGAQIVHIHRHPLNVIASLATGEVMPQHSLTAGINAWGEAIAIVQEYKVGWPSRIHEIAYEDLVTNPAVALRELLGFLGEDWSDAMIEGIVVHPERNKYTETLSAEDCDTVRSVLADQMKLYNYI